MPIKDYQKSQEVPLVNTDSQFKSVQRTPLTRSLQTIETLTNLLKRRTTAPLNLFKFLEMFLFSQ